MDGDGSPPPELQLAWWCGESNLPEAGGVLDQDYKLMREMNSLNNVYRTLARVRSMRGKEIHGMTVAERKVMKFLLAEGMV